MAGIVANGVPLAQRPSQERGFTAREMAQTDGVHDPGVWIGIAAQQYSDHKSLERIPVMGQVEEFYKAVRNKILHGYQIGSTNPEVLYPCFDMFWEIYAWVNEWHPRVTQQGKRMVFKFGFGRSK